MRVEGHFYRAHDPRWAFAPLSGEGASVKGGRFNAVGTPALYLGETIDGVVNEVSHHLSDRFQPLLLVQYKVDCDDICDLTSQSRLVEFGIPAEVLNAPWLALYRAGMRPPTWEVTERLMNEGFVGLLVRSFAVGAKPSHRNLVLWRWSDKRPHQVIVVDDEKRLPKDRSSWD